jgi:hypothetical protein
VVSVTKNKEKNTMEMENKYASKGVAGTGLGLGIAGTALGLMAGGNFPGIFGGNNCNENHVVNRYEASQAARIAELETEVKLRDANTYTDGKILEVYRYFDGKLEGVNAAICQQNVYNATNTAALNCIQGQVAQLMSLTKVVVPNSSVCPGWGDVTVSITPTTTTAG